MKKKRLHLITIIALLAALFGSGGGVAWGQLKGTRLHPTQFYLSATDTLSPVNNAFGAGESSYITPGTHGINNGGATPQVVKFPWGYGSINTDAGWTWLSDILYNNTLIDNNPDDIVLGGVKNRVIRAYTGNGFALGWISILNRVADYNNGHSSCSSSETGTCNANANSWPDENYKNNAISKSYNVKAQMCGSTLPWQDRPIYEFSFNKTNVTEFPTPPSSAPRGGTVWQWMAPCGWALFQARYPFPDHNWIEVSTHIRVDYSAGGGPKITNPGAPNYGAQVGDSTWVRLQAAPTEIPTGLYTSTIDGSYQKRWPIKTFSDDGNTDRYYPTDDGVALVQFSGSNMTDGGALKNQPKYKLKSEAGSNALGNPGGLLSGNDWGDTAKTKSREYLTNYRRPTTILLERGTHTFKKIAVKDIPWQYEIDTVVATPSSGRKLSWCCSGNAMGYSFTVDWDRNDRRDGATLVDGAVALLTDADVCVQENITDATTNSATEHTGGGAPDDKTDAVIALPKEGRSTLRVGGDIHEINMVNDSVDTKKFYKQENFPKASANIYSYPKNGVGNEFSISGTGYEFGLNSLGNFNDGGKINLPALKYWTKASVLGVYGNYVYKANNADWHTNLASENISTDHPGVIEIGTTTKGTGHMHIYSGGMLKNFGGCTVNSSFPMYLGHPGSMGDAHSAQFNLNGDQPLYITNYGVGAPSNPCDADLLFYKAATDSLASAFTSASGNGIMRIQAYNDLELRATTTINATGKGNDLYMLSDAGNVVTQEFNFTNEYVSAEKRGMLGIWAEDRGTESSFGGCGNTGIGNRNSARGNVYMNDSVKITRPTSTDGAETNVRAANNIRTAMFDYTSDNTKNDITNVISRKGDVYLGYSIKARRYNDNGDPGNTSYEFNNNIFRYNVTNTTNAGSLNIKSGWDDNVDNGEQMDGGNIYFVGIKANMVTNGTYPTNINIPFSNEYLCGSTKTTPATGLLHERKKDAMRRYEHAGIIGGVGHCGEEQFDGWNNYGGHLLGNGTPAKYTDTSLVYNGNKGDLTVDAGKRGNIIMNKGVMLNYNDDNGNATFRTRDGDIDMRDPFDAKKMKGGLLFLAQLENLSDLAKIGVCGCDEERNNVYLQDFEYTAKKNSGSVFVGADNNIKLNYGGLTNIGTRQDPFLSKPVRDNGTVYKEGFGYAGAANRGCAKMYHCDLDGNENQARTLLLNFSDSVTSGGFAAVASDMIDVYKDLKYYGGKGSGLSAVPGTGTLHGENVAGYGLFMKTQGNKANWTDNILLQAPKCPTTCLATGCDNVKAGQKPRAFLHNTVRMTFHGDARFYAENQRVHLESPVIETFGVLELNAKDKAGSNAMITIKTDSLICHDSLIRKGTGKVQFSTWSGLPKDLPIIKLGYSRRAAPFAEYSYDDGNTRKLCRECVNHYKGKVYGPGETPLDTIFVKFGPDTEWERQNVMVIDHTVITFLTDSFDHVKGGGVLNARYFVDTTKIRNQVEFWTDKNHERDGHLELISERQMGSKDYAGLYTKHLHLEPIGACGHPTSEMWLPGLALDVITTSTFGGFGIQYTDVHVENGANLNPGFTSLRLRGQCYEQACGTLTMKDLRLDGGAELHFSVGTTRGLNGEFSDAIDVDKLTTYGPVNVNIEIRPCEEIEKRCYPLIYYKSVSPNSLNTLKLHPATVKIDGEEYPLSLNLGTDGIVYLCVGNATTPTPVHTITMPETPGVKTTPGKGIWKTPARSSFPFKAVYTGTKPLVVRTNRMVNGVQEVLGGVKNANGEYEYIIPHVQQEITLTFGPDVVSNEFLAGTAVWSHGEMIYIRVERADIASIYSVAGQLVKRVDLPEGDTSIPMSRGAYVITLKDGSVHKVIVK